MAVQRAAHLTNFCHKGASLKQERNRAATMAATTSQSCLQSDHVLKTSWLLTELDLCKLTPNARADSCEAPGVGLQLVPH